MQRMKYTALIAVAVLLVSGCASHKQDNGFAKRPELKSGASASRSTRKQDKGFEPQILPDTYYAAGRVAEHQGSPDKAIEHYRKAIAVNHNYTAAYARLGLMLSLTGQHEEAADTFARG